MTSFLSLVLVFFYKYPELPEPVVFIPVASSISGRINEEFLLLMFLHVHREASDLSGELSEESVQFRLIRAACLPNLKGSIGLMLDKSSVMRVTIPLDLSSSIYSVIHSVTTFFSHSYHNVSSNNFYSVA